MAGAGDADPVRRRPRRPGWPPRWTARAPSWPPPCARAVTLAQAHVIHRAVAALPRAVDADTVAWPRRTSSRTPPSSGRRSWAGSVGGSSTSSHPRSPKQPRRLASPSSKPTPQTATRLTLSRLGDGTTRISGLRPRRGRHPARDLPRGLRQPARVRHDRDAGAGTRQRDPFDADCPIPSGWARRSPSSSRRSTRTPADPRRRRHHRHRHHAARLAAGRPRRPPTSSAPALVPSDDLTGDRLTAVQVRRLACTAKIMPAVLGGESLPLDLGRQPPLQPGPAQGAADPRPDLPRRRLRHPRHLVRRPPPSTPGATAAAPTSTTGCCSAATTTTGSMTPATAPSDSPTATSGSTDADRSRRMELSSRLGRCHRLRPSDVGRSRVASRRRLATQRPIAGSHDDRTLSIQFPVPHRDASERLHDPAEPEGVTFETTLA